MVFCLNSPHTFPHSLRYHSNPKAMNRFFIISFVCFLNVISLGQIVAQGIFLYTVGNKGVHEEFSTSHINTRHNIKSDSENFGLVGEVESVRLKSFQLYKGDEQKVNEIEIYSEIIQFDRSGKKMSCQKTSNLFDEFNFRYEFGKNGFIEKAIINIPCSNEIYGLEFFQYDSIGNVLLELRQDVEGTILAYTMRTYDGFGKLIEEKISDVNALAFSDEYLVKWEKYQEKDRQVKIHDLINSNVWRGEINENGEIVKLVNLKRLQIKKFDYLYDSRGNWIRKITSINGKEIQKEIRLIEYYSDKQNDSVELSIRVGSQIWMKENLDVKTFNNGDAIIQAQCEEEWQQAFVNKTPAWCYCEDENGELTNDVLYNYFALKDPRGLAPLGYRIASLNDWNVLFNEYGGSKGAFEKLKDLEHDDLNTAGRRGYRYRAWFLPESFWWTEDEKKICLAVDDIGRMLIYENNEEQNFYFFGLFIRCIKE